ncbi:hypothetical protein GCWU000246_00759 [Jonquetella anthropi E3_33 E1]|nr:hypothetical protein GCWU000246_00759 [Jonquetella anthropi E3_33 E1]
MINEMTDDELFFPHKRKWADEATQTATWEVYKFIHMNAVASYGTSKTKIRKWKNLPYKIAELDWVWSDAKVQVRVW